jgi:nickel/cobalt exporter
LKPQHTQVGDGDVCGSCGHAHGPTVAQAQAVTSWRDVLIVIGTIAVRPCTGALFLLILTWRFGVDYAGIVGVFVMGLGTASITILVAIASVGLRNSTLQLVNHSAVARVGAWFEICAGGIVMVLATQLVLRTI